MTVHLKNLFHSSALYTLDPLELSKKTSKETYFEVTQSMRDIWREIHRTGGPHEFKSDDTIFIKIELYKDFLKEQFDYYDKSLKQQEILDDVIRKELEGMQAVLEYDNEFFNNNEQKGGKTKNIFSNKNLFQKLCKKYCLCNKKLHTKKNNKKIKIKKTLKKV